MAPSTSGHPLLFSPKTVSKILRLYALNFFGGGGTETKKSIAKVAWKTVTLPKKEGGLGLRDICLWNKTLCLNLIWRLFTAKDSLWASWVKEYKIKGGNFWAIDASKATSSPWRSLLSLRGLCNTPELF